MGQQYFHQETSKHSLKNQRLNDNLSKMPKIRHHGQGSKLYSGKLRSPPQLFDKLGQKTNDMDTMLKKNNTFVGVTSSCFEESESMYHTWKW